MGSVNQQITPLSHFPESVTITHPHHPYYNRSVEVVRIRRGETNDIIVKLPDGMCAALAVADTDYNGMPDNADGNIPAILDLAGLCRIVKIIEVKMGSREGSTKEI